MGKWKVVLSAGLVAVIASACGVEEEGVPRFLLTDSASVMVASSESPRLEGVIRVDEVPTTEILAEFGTPTRILYGEQYATRLSDGTLVVGNSGSRELFFFSSGGDFAGALGGGGDGPGEFQRLFDLYRCERDQLVVEELSRLSVLDGGSMRFEHTVPIVGHLALARADLAGIKGDCSAALMVDSRDDAMATTGGVFDFPSTLYWADLETGVRDTVGTFAATQAYPWTYRGRPLPVRLPYGRETSWAVHPDGVVLGLAEEAMYRILDPRGRTRRIVRWNAPQGTLTDAEWAHYTDSREEWLREHPESREFQPPVGSLPRPNQKPAYARLVVDDVSRVWVQAYGLYGAVGSEPLSRWSVFTAEGEWLADVEMPDGLEVLSIGESEVTGVWEDELDRPRIRVHALDLRSQGSSS